MPQHARPTPPRAHEGQVLIIMAVSMVVLLGFLAAAVDVGLLLAQRRGAQNAVDAAALAVADAVYRGVTSTTTLDAMAAYYVQQNGITDTPTVTLDLSGTPEQVSVDVTHAVPKAFLGAIDHGPWQVHAHAVAALEPVPKNYALLALDTSAYPVDLTGNVKIDVVGGGAMSNGGMKCVGNDALTADLTVDAHTGFSQTGNCGFAGAEGSTPNAPVVPDPLASVPPPPAPGLPTTTAATPCTNGGSPGSPTITCPPGQHAGQSLRVTGTNGSITFLTGDHQLVNSTLATTGNSNPIIFNPGTYYFSNTRISLTGNGTRMQFNPGNYTFYMDGGSVTLTGNNLGYTGTGTHVEFYFKNCNVTLTGNTTTYFPPGIYYFDGGSLTLTGNSTIVGQDVFFYFTNGASWSSTGNTSYQFTAPSTALYPGMAPHLLIYSDRSSSGAFAMTGNAGTRLDGIVYLPDSTLTMTGNASGTWAQGQLIVHDLKDTGNADVKVVYQDDVQITVPAVYLIQ